jgi:hypothetical protein
MAYRRTIAALLVGVVVATACRDAAAPHQPALADVRLGKAKGRTQDALNDEPGLKAGQCFLQLGISAPQVSAPSGGATAFIAPTGQVISRVSVKAGPTCWFTPEGATGTYTVKVQDVDCYVVAGLGTQLASVAKVGPGPVCADIGVLQYLVASPPPPDEEDPGEEDPGSGGGTGGGTGEPTGPGALVVCSAVSRPTGMEWYFDYDLGTLMSLAVIEGNCSSAITLDSGDYELAERVSSSMPLSNVASDPAGRVLSYDLDTGVATIRIVGGSTTTVTFSHAVP